MDRIDSLLMEKGHHLLILNAGPSREDAILLFNPYHDKLGRFTTGGDAFGGIGVARLVSRSRTSNMVSQPSRSGSTRRVSFEKSIKENDRRRMRDQLDKQEQFLKSNLSGFTGGTPIRVEKYKGAERWLTGGYYDSQNNLISLNARSVSSMGKRFGGKNAGHISIHEQVHSRRGINRTGQSPITREASTELIARRMSFKMNGTRSSLGYNVPTRQLGNYAMRLSKNDTKKAWSWINSTHRGRTNPPPWIWTDTSLIGESRWRSLISDDGITLAEKLSYEPTERELLEMAVFDLANLGHWDEAMDMAKEEGPRLVGLVMEMAANSGIFFETNEEFQFSEIQLFNPYHDKLGRFTTGGDAFGGIAGPRERWNRLSGDQKRKVKIAAAVVGATVVVGAVGYVAIKHEKAPVGIADIARDITRAGPKPVKLDPEKLRKQREKEALVDRHKESFTPNTSMDSMHNNREQIERSLREDEFTTDDSRWLSGVSAPEVAYSENLQVVQKTGLRPETAGREEAVYLIARDLGYTHLVPPTVSEGFSSRQAWLRNTEDFPEDRTLVAKGIKGQRETFILDNLTMNYDRHVGNVLMDSSEFRHLRQASQRKAAGKPVIAKGRMVCIDHGFTMPGSREDLKALGGGPGGIHSFAPKAVTRHKLNKFELKKIGNLWAKKDASYANISRLVGPDAAQAFYANVKFSLDSGFLPPWIGEFGTMPETTKENWGAYADKHLFGD